MSMKLIDTLHHSIHSAIQKALESKGITDFLEIKLAPPTDASMGDLGFATHPLAKLLRKSPVVIAEELKECIGEQEYFETSYLNGFLNFTWNSDRIFQESLKEVFENEGSLARSLQHQGEKIQVEFSGPNTNKPQHLGHVRNNILGLSISNLWEAIGYQVVRTNIINDRGIHICKSMLAYQLWGEGKTPRETGRKGDFFVGDFYVLFDQKFKAEYKAYLQETSENPLSEDDYFNQASILGGKTIEMLQKWEEGDVEIHNLWNQMNQWVFEGFDATYHRMGIRFDWVDYESDTYLLGKDHILQELDNGVFQKRADGAIVCSLEMIGKEGNKVLLRSDGTSVYMTQDIGTALRRFEKFDPKKMIYVVADEQNYHFQVLFGVLNLIRKGMGDKCSHLSYGMVELPDGKMKSREGTVVDADHLMDELQQKAIEKVTQHFPDLSETEALERAEKIGQAGLKFYILKTTPASRMKFDPEESINEKGETGVYCLYQYARANSILNKEDSQNMELQSSLTLSHLGTELELKIAKQLLFFPKVVREAAENQNPSHLCSYLWQLSKSFSTFYQDRDHRIVDSPSPQKEARLNLIQAMQKVLKEGLALIGIETIEQM